MWHAPVKVFLGLPTGLCVGCSLFWLGGCPNVTGPMKTDLNAGIFESVFIVESDRASFKLQNDTKIDLLATFFPEICSRERYKGIATPS